MAGPAGWDSASYTVAAMSNEQIQGEDVERVLLGWPKCKAVILEGGRWSHPTTDSAGKRLCGEWLELDADHEKWLADTVPHPRGAARDPGRGRCRNGHGYALLRWESDYLRKEEMEAAENGERQA